MKFLLSLILLASTCAVSGFADSSAKFAQPILGFVYDGGSRSIRPLMGIPGASALGDPLDAGFPVSAAAISPRQDFALAVAADSGEVRLLEYRNRQAIVSQIPGLSSHPTRMLLSSGGTSAGLYQDSSRRLQIITGLPGSPTLKQESTLPEFIIHPHTIVVSDDGELTLILSAGAAWMAVGAATPTRLDLLEQVSAVAFHTGTHDALFAAPHGTLYLARKIEAGFASREIKTGLDNVSDPIAVEFSRDGLRAHMALADGTLVSTELGTGASEWKSCRCTPAGLQALQPGSLFQLNHLSDGPLMLFDTTERQPQVWFVPSLPLAADSQRSRQ